MNIAEVKSAGKANDKARRVGRGNGSGLGKTCGKGHKGQRSRSGFSTKAQDMGGQMPLFRRLPKRGFNNARYRKTYQVVNVCDLERLFDDGATVDAQTLADAHLIRKSEDPVKVLGNGELKKKLTVTADAFTKSAVEKITAAGGTTSTKE